MDVFYWEDRTPKFNRAVTIKGKNGLIVENSKTNDFIKKLTCNRKPLILTSVKQSYGATTLVKRALVNQPQALVAPYDRAIYLDIRELMEDGVPTPNWDEVKVSNYYNTEEKKNLIGLTLRRRTLVVLDHCFDRHSEIIKYFSEMPNIKLLVITYEDTLKKTLKVLTEFDFHTLKLCNTLLVEIAYYHYLEKNPDLQNEIQIRAEIDRVSKWITDFHVATRSKKRCVQECNYSNGRRFCSLICNPAIGGQ